MTTTRRTFFGLAAAGIAGAAASKVGQSAAQQVTLPAAARAAVSLERARDRIRDLAGHVSIGRRHQRRGRVNGRCIHDGVQVIAELLLRGPQDRLPAAPHAAGRTRRRGAARIIHRD